MKNFSIKDANPKIAADLGQMSKEVNDLVVLITTASGPLIQKKHWNQNAETQYALLREENDFKVSGECTAEGNEIKRFSVVLSQGGVNRMKLAYAVRDNKPVVVTVLLDCEGEELVQNELERMFKRDFSFESHSIMAKDLDELRPPAQEAIVSEEEEREVTNEDPTSPVGEPERPVDEVENTSEDTSISQEQEISEEVTKELHELSDRMLDSIDEVQEIIQRLNSICHDISRGSTPSFAEDKIEEEVLENGAKVHMVDRENNGYKVTFRKGSLDDLSEVSFFLEKEGELVFSVYLSSQGNGKVTVGSDQPKVLLDRIARDLKS